MRHDRLFVATLGYLLAPNVIFAVGWMKPAWAAIVTAAIVYGFAHAVRRAETRAAPLSGREWAFVAALAVFWTCASGIGELNVQAWDYVKHNLVFRDLVANPWPVAYSDAGRGDPILCYYLAYYLPPSLVGKLVGLEHTATASLVWGGLGVLLSFAWVCRLGRPHGIAVLAAFTLVDGFGWLSGVVAQAHRLLGTGGAGAPAARAATALATSSGEFPYGPAQLKFHCEAANLLWTPQHALAAWLATALVLRLLWEERDRREVALLWAALLLWSPFVAAGLLPFAAAVLLRAPRRLPPWPDLAAGVCAALPAGTYLASHLPLQYAGLYFGTLASVGDWWKYGVFLLKSVGILWCAAALVRRRCGVPDRERWLLLCLAATTLVAVTFVYVGRYNDWAMRASMPSLMVFRILLAVAAVELWARSARLVYRFAFTALLLLSSVRSLKHYILVPAGRFSGRVPDTAIATADREAASLAVLKGFGGFDFAGQYLGDRASFFARKLMRAPRRPPLAPAAGDRGPAGHPP